MVDGRLVRMCGRLVRVDGRLVRMCGRLVRVDGRLVRDVVIRSGWKTMRSACVVIWTSMMGEQSDWVSQ